MFTESLKLLLGLEILQQYYWRHQQCDVMQVMTSIFLLLNYSLFHDFDIAQCTSLWCLLLNIEHVMTVTIRGVNCINKNTKTTQ